MNRLHPARLLAYAFVVVMPLWFSNCKKNSDDAVTPVSVEGNWHITAMKLNPALDTGIFGKVDDFYKLFVELGAETCLKELVITFNSNGTTTSNNPKSCQDSTDELSDVAPVSNGGKWVMTGTKLTMTETDGTVTTYDVTMSGNTLSLSSQGELVDANNKKVKTTLTMVLTRV